MWMRQKASESFWTVQPMGLSFSLQMAVTLLLLWLLIRSPFTTLTTVNTSRFSGDRWRSAWWSAIGGPAWRTSTSGDTTDTRSERTSVAPRSLSTSELRFISWVFVRFSFVLLIFCSFPLSITPILSLLLLIAILLSEFWLFLCLFADQCSIRVNFWMFRLRYIRFTPLTMDVRIFNKVLPTYTRMCIGTYSSIHIALEQISVYLSPSSCEKGNEKFS